MAESEDRRVSAILDSGYALLRFPLDLERQYLRHYVETRLITSTRLITTGLIVFCLFAILDFIAFPLTAAIHAWMIRAGTGLIVAATLGYTIFVAKGRPGYLMLTVLALLINTAVVAIDVIGSSAAGYSLTLGSLFVMIASCTLVRFPFWISVLLVTVMAATQMGGMILFMHLNPPSMLNNTLFYAFIAVMVLISNYSQDSDSRKIFLLSYYRRKYERSGLDKTSADRQAERIDAYMRQEKPYLNPDLTIDDASKSLGIRRHHLTQIINETHGSNFLTYLNRFRVSEARNLLESASDMTILRIAYDTGFNSKATFNRMFKRLVGKSPSEYREASRRKKNPDEAEKGTHPSG